ncbi:3298_t:CDS:10 [Entrophospora sp. SA101]|nr:3298_t:CDS:10 [Entrophospora sp. SA101]
MEHQGLLATYGIPITPGSRPPNSSNVGRRSTGTVASRTSNRYSVTALYSMATEQDVEVEDELARAQRILRDLKIKISSQSKKNFVLERDVRYLDSRIALLIQNRMALDEKQEVESHLEETDPQDGNFPDDRKLQLYGNLFFLLQTEPGHIANLCRLVALSEIDTLLQTVMFTLYGNQYESREEHLLLTMFQSVLSAQFETTADFNSLLRANTPVSRMMTTYTRRGPGQSYLKSMLSERINNLIEHKDLNLEINPLKVYEQVVKKYEEENGFLPPDLPRSVTTEVAAANPEVMKIIQPRMKMLIEIANKFLITIIESIEQVPYGIRWICKQIRSLTKRKYPNATEIAICSLIGGFFFLRFVNPAVVTPQAYMLVDGVPSTHPRRTLTLVAKMLQNLANKPSYAKEDYMGVLNDFDFVENNKQKINKFLLELCEVGDFYESLEAPSENNHLRILLDDLSLAPSQVPRNENKAIELPLFKRDNDNNNNLFNLKIFCLDIATSLLADNSLTQNDILYMEAKSIIIQIIRSIPQMAERRPIDLLWIAETAATTKDALLVRKGIKVKEMLRELEEAKVIERSDGHLLMTEEVEQELAHLGNLREGVTKEIRSLESVYKTICDHNNYLRSQLDNYKIYLQNVRKHAANDSAGGFNSSVVKVGDKQKKTQKSKIIGPYKFTYIQLEKEGIIEDSSVPDNRREGIFFNISSPLPGAFMIALYYKGRDAAILEMDLKLDDLLEKNSGQLSLKLPNTTGILKLNEN